MCDLSKLLNGLRLSGLIILSAELGELFCVFLNGSTFRRNGSEVKWKKLILEVRELLS